MMIYLKTLYQYRPMTL